MTNYLAIDLGAESGRTIVGSLVDGKLTLFETHRFPNRPVRLNDGLHWDVLRLWSDIKDGITKSKPFDSIGLDTWAVDSALLDKNNSLLGNPFHYRDARTSGMMEKAFKVMPSAEIFANSGIQFMQLNTLYQLMATEKSNPSLFDIAKTFLTIPDLFNFWLTGELTNEFTNATTTQCFDPRARDWSRRILTTFNIPTHLFKPTTDPGTQIGTLLPSLAEETGSGEIPVILPACHDTGSAVVAVPAKNENFAWLSSGTWSIMGAEVHEPCLTEKALEYNFTNEGGVFGTWRLSKNIMGLWLVQGCKRTWAHLGDDISYDEITRLASEARPFLAVIEPDNNRFLHPGDMPERIQTYCAETNQAMPQTRGEIIRVALESVALKYRWVLARLEELTDKQFATIHIIGGGTKNRLLNQFTANATDRVVVTGPVEATAIGNVLMQAIGLEHLGSLSDARAVVRASFHVEEYHPTSDDGWNESYAKLLKLMERNGLEK
jgi:rhamnulokinase